MTTLATPLGRALLAIAAPLALLAGCLGLSGCNMLREFGENAGQTPGFHMRIPSLFAQGEVSATGDTNVDVRKLLLTAASPDGTKGWGLEFEGTVGQNVTEPMKQVPAILREFPALLESRVKITEAIAEMVPASINAIADAVSPIAAGAHALVGVFEAANRPVPQDVSELVARIAVLEAAVKEAQATTQPAGP